MGCKIHNPVDTEEEFEIQRATLSELLSRCKVLFLNLFTVLNELLSYLPRTAGSRNWTDRALASIRTFTPKGIAQLSGP